MEEDRRATFESQSFAEGRFRRAYRGTWTAPPREAGHPCVVKELKEGYSWEPTDWDTTIKITERAKELAAPFNAEIHTNKPISFTDVHVLQVNFNPDPYKRPMLNECVTCEDHIPGTFKKWCSNYGFIDDESSSLHAFMHWSWGYTRGEEMVADLQGVRNPHSFKLTDPVIISLSESYGATDMGVEGMTMFFLKHQCNPFCQRFTKPTLAHFRGIIPQHLLDAAKALSEQNQGSTTYTVERKFPPEIRAKVAAKFREIAQIN